MQQIEQHNQMIKMQQEQKIIEDLRFVPEQQEIPVALPQT